MSMSQAQANSFTILTPEQAQARTQRTERLQRLSEQQQQQNGYTARVQGVLRKVESELGQTQSGSTISYEERLALWSSVAEFAIENVAALTQMGREGRTTSATT
jgi:hypothetical protein